MESDINNEIYEQLKKNCKVGQSSDPLLKKIKFDEKMAKYYDIRKYVLSKTYRVRMLLIMAFKEITWRKEIENKFDIHPAKISDFFEYMKEKGMILFRPFSEVDNVLFQSVLRQNSNAFYGKRDSVKVYTLSPEGKEIVKKLMDDILKLTNERTDLQQDVNYILEKTDTHRKILTDLRNKELEFFEREVLYPDGTLIIQETQKSKQLKQDIIEFRQELLQRQEKQGLLSDKGKQELMEIKAQTLSEVKKSPINRPKALKLSKKELEQEEISDKEVKRVQDEIKKERVAKLEKLNNEALEGPYTRILLGGIIRTLRKESEKKKARDSGMDFLNSL